MDDSNQAAEVPPVGSKFDRTLGRIVQCDDEVESRTDENEENGWPGSCEMLPTVSWRI